NGFRDAHVIANVADDYQGKRGEVAVTLRIDEGTQYRVRNLNVTGVTRENSGQIIARLASASGQPFSETSVALDRDTLLNIYQSSGYPDVSFDWRLTTDPANHLVDITYIIAEGKPRYVRNVLITGLHNTRHRLVDPNVLLKSGDPLSWTTMAD